jgi:pimeloyl-ACP methyl ester carboxylesterase
MPRSRVLVFLIVVLTLALLAVPVRGIGAQDATPEATPAPRFTTTVEVDGRRIGLTCEGSGSPTVILIGGLQRASDIVWPHIVDAISPVTRVCVFDRAGMGPSDPQPSSPQTAADVVTDLHAALEAAGETGPFVPVGFSVGGYFARLYASTYPDELGGLVLVEGTPPGATTRDFALDWFPSAEERAAAADYATGTDSSIASPIDFFASDGQVYTAPPPPPVPTIMLVAGRIDPEIPLLSNVTWYEGQAYQARDLNARVVYAEKSGHFVSLDQPEVVIAAIENVVEAVRDPSSWVTPAAGTPSP